MYKKLSVQEQLQMERNRNSRINSIVTDITEEVEIETENGLETTRELKLKKENEELKQLLADLTETILLGGNL